MSDIMYSTLCHTLLEAIIARDKIIKELEARIEKLKDEQIGELHDDLTSEGNFGNDQS